MTLIPVTSPRPRSTQASDGVSPSWSSTLRADSCSTTEYPERSSQKRISRRAVGSSSTTATLTGVGPIDAAVSSSSIATQPQTHDWVPALDAVVPEAQVETTKGG